MKCASIFHAVILVSIGRTAAFSCLQPHILLYQRSQIQIQKPSPVASRQKNTLAAHKNRNQDEPDEQSILLRFVSPRIDDAGLPIADALLAQIVAPFLQIVFIALTHRSLPTWLQPSSSIAATSLLAPTLVHGAGLACCWLGGALAARLYQADAFDVSENKGYGTVVTRVIQAGAFATGLLIISTQVDLFIEFGGLAYGEEADGRIAVAVVELFQDVLFEAVTLGSWRVYRASLTADS